MRQRIKRIVVEYVPSIVFHFVAMVVGIMFVFHAILAQV